MHYYLIPETEMKNIYIVESFSELNDKSPSLDELIEFEEHIRKVPTVEEGFIEGVSVDIYVNYYILKYRSKFPNASENYERHTAQEVKAIISTILEGL